VINRSNAHQAAELKGRRAETLAALVYFFRGYRIFKRRFRTKGGEIDLVAVKNSLVVLCEVKARAHLEDALSSVTPKSKRRIESAGRVLISKHPRLAEKGLRHDIAWVADWRVKIIQDAWREGE